MNLVGVLYGGPRPGNGSSNWGVTAEVEEGRSLSDGRCRIVIESECARRGAIQSLVKEKSIAKERSLEGVRYLRRKQIGVPCDQGVHRKVVTDWEARKIRSAH